MHGARGAGNALGAIADINRNETPVVMVVGLPSTASAKFLPPHGEENLISVLEGFSKKVVCFDNGVEDIASSKFVNLLVDGFLFANKAPFGPVVFAVSQDVLNVKWIAEDEVEAAIKNIGPVYSEIMIDFKVTDSINNAKNLVIMIDDYYLKYPDSVIKLKELAEKLDAPVMQIRYRRGPMLFERLPINSSRNFIGWYDPCNKNHHELLNNADLLITIEDRNMYSRVTGALPQCEKIVINSSTEKALKNDYIDLLKDKMLVGNPVEVINELIDNVKQKERQFAKEIYLNTENEQIPKNEYYNMRLEIVGLLNSLIEKQKTKLIIDDSQMFGGLVSSVYDLLADNIKIYGDHGAFVGGGMAIASGLATTINNDFILCFVGDQGFINGLQVLTFCQEHDCPIVFVVCNNGRSVSLTKQLSNIGSAKKIELNNPENFSITDVANGFGIKCEKFVYAKDNVDDFIEQINGLIEYSINKKKPLVLELVISSDEKYWEGVWNNQGYEKISF